MSAIHYGHPASPSNRSRKARHRRQTRVRSPIRDDDVGVGLSAYGKRGWDELAEREYERPAKRRKLSGFEHPLYISRQEQQNGRRVRRIIMEEEEDPVVEDEEEEEDEDRVELPTSLSDDEDEEAEIQRLMARDCVGCRLLLGMEKDVLPVVRPEIMLKIDRIMFSGLKNGNTIDSAKLAADEFARFVIDPLNAERAGVRRAPIPAWTWQSIRRHYKENQCDNDSFALYEHMRKMETTVDAVRGEVAFLENSGPLEIDPQTGEKHRGLVKRCRVATAKTEHAMRKDIVLLRLRIKREMALEEARLLKSGIRRTGSRPPSIMEDINTVRRGEAHPAASSHRGGRRTGPRRR